MGFVVEEVALGQVFFVVLIILEQYFSQCSPQIRSDSRLLPWGNSGCISVMDPLKVIYFLIKGI